MCPDVERLVVEREGTPDTGRQVVLHWPVAGQNVGFSGICWHLSVAVERCRLGGRTCIISAAASAAAGGRQLHSFHGLFH